jgi:hypothetical protein
MDLIAAYHTKDRKLYDETVEEITEGLEVFIQTYDFHHQDKLVIKIRMPFECTTEELNKEQAEKLIETLQKMVQQL